MTQILSIVGTRPQYIKLSQMINCFIEFGVDHGYIDTGQHYDPHLSQDLIESLKLPSALCNLGVGGLSRHIQISKATSYIFEFVKGKSILPQLILVYGDTNATVSGALAARLLGVPVCHIESGLRSFEVNQPEEVNRIITDQVSDLLLTPTMSAFRNLEVEHLDHKAKFTGDLTLDVFNGWNSSSKHQLIRKFENHWLLTLHRPHNVDHEETLKMIFQMLKNSKQKFILPLHPRLQKNLQNFGIEVPHNTFITQPLLPRETLEALNSSLGLVTDSGGLQKEAFLLKKRTITIGSFTEWNETLQHNWNTLWSPESDNLESFVEYLNRPIPDAHETSWLGRGSIAKNILNSIQTFIDN